MPRQVSLSPLEQAQFRLKDIDRALIEVQNELDDLDICMLRAQTRPDQELQKLAYEVANYQDIVRGLRGNLRNLSDRVKRQEER